MPRTTPNRKTPGVYVTELDAFPPSIVGIQTAIPAFIGYTERAEISGKPVYNQAIKINSLVEYEAVFGQGYKPLYEIVEITDETQQADGDYDFTVLSYVDPPSRDTATLKYYDLNQVGSTQFELYDSMRLFFANGGGTCYVISVGSYHDPSTDSVRAIALSDLQGGLSVAGEEQGPTMLVVPDSVLLSAQSDFTTLTTDMIQQAESLQDRVALLDVYGTQTIGTTDADDNLITLEKVIGDFRTGLASLTTRQLSYGVAYFPFLRTTVWSPDEVDYTNIDSTSVTTLQQLLTWQNTTLNWDFATGAATPRYTSVDEDIQAISEPGNTQEQINALNLNLTAALPLMGDIDRIVLRKNELSPTAGTMAGIYASNDQTKGVWNAPANVSLRSVNGVSYKLDNASQADLNMPVNGMAIDAIRDFQNRGQVVWGARTLDGNSPDFRYVQVRRTLIYIEQSIKAALDPFVFAANDGKTWVAVTSMVSGFLQGLWNQGGLMGATASEAFSVECGLGSTMTGQDILDGYMIVNVTLQMIRPAEFIELTFKQKMEGVA